MTTNAQKSVPTYHAGAWPNLATSTAVKPVRKPAPVKWRLPANVITERAP